MMRYLEIPDFHFSPRWAKTSMRVAASIKEAATENKVDFIALVGDFFDHPIYASDKGGLKTAKDIIDSWLSVCPVLAIEGTPSHDAPGCYRVFNGITLLKPGTFHEIAGGIVFGIPELSKKNIQAKLGLSSDEASAEAINQLKRYILEYVAPIRLKHADKPAVGLLHGNVSDYHRSNEIDVILKSSDIVIHTEDLEPAGLDRWSLGHIHTPWESEKINAGYAGFTGIDGNPWGKTGFTPAMNLIEIGKPVIRIPYGTPKRLKVSEAPISPEPNTAYWIETSNPEMTLPEGLHPWSRITYVESKEETRRVTEEEAKEAITLWDLFTLINPEGPDVKDKVDQIAETIKHDFPERKDVQIKDIVVKGCMLFRGKTVSLSINNLPSGLNLISGENGSGKSSLLSFCHPYPLIIGKDTKSGRISAIKDFFTGRESSIEKTVVLNGQEHKHLITI